jgi:hypothetical protein
MLELVRFSDLAAILDLKKPSLDDYPSLKTLITSVYAAIESHTGRWLEFGDYTEVVETSGKLIGLRALPISNINSIDFDGEEYPLEQIKIGKYDVKLPEYKDGVFTISYSGGLESPTAELSRAALLQVAHEWQRKDQIGSTFSTNEGGSVTWPELVLLKEVRAMLAPYTVPSRLV